MKHFLLIRFSSLGDIVLTTAILPMIKIKYPSSKITFLTSKPFEVILKGHPLINTIISIDRKKDSLFQIVKKVKLHHQSEPLDQIIDLHKSLRSLALTKMLFWLPVIKVNKRTLLRNIFVMLKTDFLKKEYQVDRYLKDFKLFLGELTREQVSAFLKREDLGVTSLPKFHNDYNLKDHSIIIAPGASFKAKAWPVNQFIELINKLKISYPNYELVLVGNESEVDAQALQNLDITNKIGRTSLTDLCSLISNASMVICNDSAVGHIAEAYGVKAISIMGPTHESFGFGLHSLHSLVLSQENISCRPCSTKGNKACKLKEPICFTRTTADHVSDQVKVLMNL